MATLAAPQVELIGSRPDGRQEALLQRMRKQFSAVEEYEHKNRLAQVDDLKFRAGQQWREVEEQRRISAGRPCLTVNTLPQYERQVTNEMRQNMPAITVLPVGNGADVETAKLLKGLVRHVDQASNGKAVRQQAYDSAVRIGAGYWRLVLEYDDWLSFDQEPRLAGIRNPFQVYLDHAAQKSTGQDAQWGFVFEQQDRAAFEEEWGLDSHTMTLWQGTGDQWVFSEHVRVAEYFWRDRQRMTLAQLQDKSVRLLEPELMAQVAMLESQGLNPGRYQEYVARLLTPSPRWVPLLPWIREQSQVAYNYLSTFYPQEVAVMLHAQIADVVGQVVQVRPTEHEIIRWVKTNGYVILEESIWPGTYIPLIRVIGEEIDLENEVIRSGIIRHAKDPMRLENYWITMQAEHIALSPVPPWLLTPNQIAGYEQYWDQSNTTPYAYLPYNPDAGRDGSPVPPPVRQAFEPPVQAITVALQVTQQYTQNALGIHQGNLGGPSQERSGIAIANKDKQADTGTYHYADNLAQSMHYEGLQLVDLLPKVLTPGKVQRILGDDGSPQQIMLTNRQQGIEPPPQLPSGLAGFYDTSTGTFDVVVELGPSYATKRQEAAQQMLELTRALPQAMGPVIHRVVGVMDWDGASELADLLKQLPGQILGDPGTNKDALFAQLKQQFGQLVQQLQAVNAHAQQVEQEAGLLARENQELKAGFAIDRQKLALDAQAEQNDYKIALAKLELDNKRLALERDTAHAEIRLKAEAQGQRVAGSAAPAEGADAVTE